MKISLLSKKQYTKHKAIKIAAVILVLGLFFVRPTLAADGDWLTLLQDVMWFFSWAWIIFAGLAGKLMSNDWVYGSFLNLDTYMWKIWNIMKNFANYVIGFMFLYYIIKSFFSNKDEDSPMNVIKTKISKFLIAWILIQASWFLVAALLDVVTIATAGMSAFPAKFVEWMPSMQSTILETVKPIHGRIITIEENEEWEFYTETEVTETEIKNLYDFIMPKTDTIWWPLIYMWFSIFQFQDFLKLTENQDPTDLWSITISMLIRFLILIVFTFSMILLFIINLIRILYLWVIIMFSPFLILFKTLDGGEDKFQSVAGFDLKTLVNLAFKPVIYMAVMSIILIFIMSIWWIMDKSIDDTKMDVYDVNLTNTGMNANEIFETQVDGDIFFNAWDSALNGFSALIVYVFALILIRSLVKVAAGGNKITDGAVKRTSGLIEKTLKTVPILPINEWISFWAAQESWRDAKNKTGIQIGKGGTSFSTQGIRDRNRKFEADINKAWWLWVTWWTSEYATKVIDAAIAGSSTAESFFTNAKAASQEITGGLSIQNASFVAQLENWLKNHGHKSVDGKVLGKRTTEENIKEYFDKDPNRVTKLHELMWWNKNSNRKLIPKNFEDLSKTIYGAS